MSTATRVGAPIDELRRLICQYERQGEALTAAGDLLTAEVRHAMADHLRREVAIARRRRLREAATGGLAVLACIALVLIIAVLLIAGMTTVPAQ